MGEALPPTFEELVDDLRGPLAELEAIYDELDQAMRAFVRDIRAALDRYDRDAEP